MKFIYLAYDETAKTESINDACEQARTNGDTVIMAQSMNRCGPVSENELASLLTRSDEIWLIGQPESFQKETGINQLNFLMGPKEVKYL